MNAQQFFGKLKKSLSVSMVGLRAIFKYNKMSENINKYDKISVDNE